MAKNKVRSGIVKPQRNTSENQLNNLTKADRATELANLEVGSNALASKTPMADIEDRAQRVIGYIRDGKGKREVSKLMDDLSPTQLARAYKKAYEILKQESESMAKNIAIVQFERMEFLWTEAINNKNYTLALDVLKEVNRMCGNNIQNVINVQTVTDENNKPRITINVVNNDE